MAETDRGDRVEPAVELRASHEDRDRVAEILRVAAGDGRLTAEELDERLEAALVVDADEVSIRSGSAKVRAPWLFPRRPAYASGGW